MKNQPLLKKYILLLLFLPISYCFGQVQTVYVQPIQTDPNYSPSEDSMAVSRNASSQQNNLFLFIGGTNSSSATAYNALRLHSANLGFDFVNLSYPNTVAAASLSNDNDSLAFDKYRQEICFGTPVSNDVAVDSLNSIATRTLKLIQFLQLTYPAQNWGQYLASANSIDWSKIIIGGHSQGAGHAAYIAKQELVDRVLMFAGPNDYSDFYANSANWLRQPGTTAVNQHFAYLSLNDEVVNFSKQFDNLSGLGMLTTGDTTYVDNSATPYGNAQFLYTTQAPGLVILNHNVPVKLSAINSDVWTYMLTATIATGLNYGRTDASFSIFPNPATSVVGVKSAQALVGEVYTLRNMNGQMMGSGRIPSGEDGKVDVSGLVSGVYLLSIGNATLRLIKR